MSPRAHNEEYLGCVSRRTADPVCLVLLATVLMCNKDYGEKAWPSGPQQSGGKVSKYKRHQWEENYKWERFEIVVILTLSLHFPGFRVLTVIRSGYYYAPPEWVQNVPIKNTGEEDAETNNLVWSSLKQHWLLQQNISFNCSSFVVGALKWLLCFITANHCQYKQLNLFSDEFLTAG